MGKTYKDRPARYDLPRVPSWARPKPEKFHDDETAREIERKAKRKPVKDEDYD